MLTGILAKLGMILQRLIKTLTMSLWRTRKRLRRLRSREDVVSGNRL
jgi:hypothetical protein